MVSRYSIIQYVPNPISDERINIGVLAFDDQLVKVEFSTYWDRVRCFGMEDDIDYLQDFVKQMRESTNSGLLFPGDIENETPRHERLLNVSQTWMNSIQFTAPKGSLKSVEKVLTDAIKKFLILPPKTCSKRPKLRDRQAAAKLTVSKIKKAAKRLLGEQYQNSLKEKCSIPGKHIPHEIDVAIANSQPYLAAQGVSFEVNPPKNLLDALSWTITDIKDKDSRFPIGIVVLPPKQNLSKQYERLEQIFYDRKAIYQELGATVLGEDEVDSWVERTLPIHR